MAAPDSALREGLGGYAGTFVRWHLWDAVRCTLAPQGRPVQDPGARGALAGHPGFERLSQLLNPPPEKGSRHILWDFQVTPWGEICSLLRKSLRGSQSQRPELFAVGDGIHTFRSVQNVRSVCDVRYTAPDGLPARGQIGFAVAWGVRRMYALLLHSVGASRKFRVLAVELDREGGGATRLLFDWPGPWATTSGCFSWAWEPTGMACSPGGRWVYLMGDAPQGRTRVVAFDAKEGRVEREWELPHMTNLVVTPEGFLVFMCLPWRFGRPGELSFATYDRLGKTLLNEWAVVIPGLSPPYLQSGLFYDPQAQLLIAAVEDSQPTGGIKIWAFQ
jgi:hypothetical protein